MTPAPVQDAATRGVASRRTARTAGRRGRFACATIHSTPEGIDSGTCEGNGAVDDQLQHKDVVARSVPGDHVVLPANDRLRDRVDLAPTSHGERGPAQRRPPANNRRRVPNGRLRSPRRSDGDAPAKKEPGERGSPRRPEATECRTAHRLRRDRRRKAASRTASSRAKDRPSRTPSRLQPTARTSARGEIDQQVQIAPASLLIRFEHSGDDHAAAVADRQAHAFHVRRQRVRGRITEIIQIGTSVLL